MFSNEAKGLHVPLIDKKMIAGLITLHQVKTNILRAKLILNDGGILKTKYAKVHIPKVT